jgi:hypothetical protein
MRTRSADRFWTASIEPGVTLVTRHVDRIVIERGCAVGVQVGGKVLAADLLIDASGRASRVTASVRPAAIGYPCGAAYVSRHYQLRDGADTGPENSPLGLSLSLRGYSAIVFTHDNRTVSGRPAMSEMMREQDPAVLVRGWAWMLAEIDHRVAPLVRAMEVAAGLDHGARSAYDTALGQRLLDAGAVVDRLIKLNALNDGVTAQEAVDIAWLYGDPALYERLVRQRGWHVDRFAQWLGDLLCRELLAGSG